jgi:citrate/tricarballylate utilization protein
MQLADGIREGERVMAVCNACRYCQGYCAVFPAMERRLEFSRADLNYLANLCHNCAECYYACPYTAPHEFAINVPKTLAEIRLLSYQQYAWPNVLGRAFRWNAPLTALLVVLSLTFFMLHSGSVQAAHQVNFYNVVSHSEMVFVFAGVALLVMIECLIGVARFWKDSGENFSALVRPGVLVPAVRDILKLEYLRSGGRGCTYPNEHHSHARRWFHHFTFYGFMMCLAATCVAAFYDNFLGWRAPYPVLSLPVVLGTVGGIGLLVGPAGLLALKRQRDPQIVDPNQNGMDLSFIALLLGSSITGLLLLAMRGTHAMGFLLILHLAVVLAVFASLPYGKFVHGMYRAMALLRYEVEKLRSPLP